MHTKKPKSAESGKNVKRSRTSRESSRNTRGSLTRGIAVNTENRRWEKWQKAEIRQNTDTVWTVPNPETRHISPQNQYNLQEPKRSRAPKRRYSLHPRKDRKMEISPKLLSTGNPPRRHGLHVNLWCVPALQRRKNGRTYRECPVRIVLIYLPQV